MTMTGTTKARTNTTKANGAATKRTTNGKDNGTSKKGGMSDEHKAALARGRDESRIVNQYLKAMATTTPRRGRPVNVDALRQELATVEADIAGKTGAAKVVLAQRRMDLRDRIKAFSAPEVDTKALQAAFVSVVGPYSERMGLTAQAWREAGVSRQVLRLGGVPRA